MTENSSRAAAARLDRDPAARAARAQLALEEILRPLQQKNPPLIAFGGPMGAGKDSIADYLEPLGPYQRTFTSEPLHEALMIQNPWIRLDKPVYAEEHPEKYWMPGEFLSYRDLTNLNGYVAAKQQRDYREILQRTGNDMGRNFLGTDTWVQVTRITVADWAEQQKPGIVTGIRYQNDLELMQRFGALTVWLERPQGPAGRTDTVPEALPGLDRITRALDDAIAQHESEVSLQRSDFEVTVWNNGDLEDLQRAAAIVHALAAEPTDHSQREIWACPPAEDPFLET